MREGVPGVSRLRLPFSASILTLLLFCSFTAPPVPKTVSTPATAFRLVTVANELLTSDGDGSAAYL